MDGSPEAPLWGRLGERRPGPHALDNGLLLVGLAGSAAFWAWWNAPRSGWVGLRPDGLERHRVCIAWGSLEELACADGWLAARGSGRRILVHVGTDSWVLAQLSEMSRRPISRALPEWARQRLRLRDRLGLMGMVLTASALLGLLVRALLR